jgi:hypothetical protein
MIANKNRIGRFTSSNIWKLMTDGRGEEGLGEPAITYIEEKRAERCLGRSIDLGAHSQPLTWGKVMEVIGFEEEMGLDYSLCSSETILHPKYNFWSGSPDARTSIKASEMKCFYPKAYYELSRDLMLENLDVIKANHKEIYWQVISNAIILGLKKAEIIAFTPTEKQLIAVREKLSNTDFAMEKLGMMDWQVRWIYEKELYELPYIPGNIQWPNCVKFEFDVLDKDVIALTKRVLLAEKILTR